MWGVDGLKECTLWAKSERDREREGTERVHTASTQGARCEGVTEANTHAHKLPEEKERERERFVSFVRSFLSLLSFVDRQRFLVLCQQE